MYQKSQEFYSWYSKGTLVWIHLQPMFSGALQSSLYILQVWVMIQRFDHCWRKIRTPRQAHSKPNKLASHTSRFQSVPVNFPWKLTKDKVVKYQSLELAGWYQTVPYLRLESHVRWHIAMRSHVSTD
jgi:hypothetical protein